MVDPVSGLAAPKWQLGCGVVAFAREDRNNFTVDLFWDVYSYIFHLMDFYGDYPFNYQNFKRDRLNENAFERYQIQERLAQLSFEQ